VEEIQACVRGVLRLLLFVLLILVYLTNAFVIHIVTRDEVIRRRRFTRNGHRCARLAIVIFGINTVYINKPKEDEKFLLVSNHMGFIDIMGTFAAMPIVFVTSHEMREAPLLGLLTEMAGCIYVERRSRSQIVNELKGIADALKEGFRIVLYPEATSTNGEQVLPFKRTLMMAAAQAGVPIQPVVVNFLEINGQPFSLKNRDRVCWYGDMGFMTAIWNSFTLKSLTIQIEFLEKFYPTMQDDRGAVADKAHDMIAAKFRPAVPAVQNLPTADYETDPT
jgi:1-acyl-sn-glycerol-3-phosphate acyltransferase